MGMASVVAAAVSECGKFSPDDGIAPLQHPVQPNPVRADENLTIPVKALRPVVVAVEISNVAGENLYSTTQSIAAAGQESFSIPTQMLKSGVYHYRIRPLDGGRGMVSGEFVVLK